MARKEDPKYLLVLRSLVKDYSVVVKVLITKTKRLKFAGSEDEARELWRKLVRNLPIETIESLEKLLKRRLDELYLAKDQVSAKKPQKKPANGHKHSETYCPVLGCRRRHKLYDREKIYVPEIIGWVVINNHDIQPVYGDGYESPS